MLGSTVAGRWWPARRCVQPVAASHCGAVNTGAVRNPVATLSPLFLLPATVPALLLVADNVLKTLAHLLPNRLEIPDEAGLRLPQE